MIYGSPCNPYPSRWAKTGLEILNTLPKTTVTGVNQLSFSYQVVADEEETYCTPTGQQQWTTKYSVYLDELRTVGEPLRFSSTWRVLYTQYDEDVGILTGPKVGELVDNGSGVLEGELKHPDHDDTIYLEVFPLSACTDGFATATRINGERTTPDYGSPTYHKVGQYTQMNLGGIWYEESPCGETLAEDAYDGFPSWYYTLPDYQLTGGDWNEQLRQGTYTSAIACRIYNSGFFFGYHDVSYVDTFTPDTCGLLYAADKRWWYFADLDGRCGGKDKEKLRAYLEDARLLISFGRPWGGNYADAGHTTPVAFYGSNYSTGTFAQTDAREYLATMPYAGGTGWDWIGSSTLNRQSAAGDASLDGSYFAGPIPDQLVLTASY